MISKRISLRIVYFLVAISWMMLWVFYFFAGGLREIGGALGPSRVSSYVWMAWLMVPVAAMCADRSLREIRFAKFILPCVAFAWGGNALFWVLVIGSDPESRIPPVLTLQIGVCVLSLFAVVLDWIGAARRRKQPE